MPPNIAMTPKAMNILPPYVDDLSYVVGSYYGACFIRFYSLTLNFYYFVSFFGFCYENL